MSDELSRLDTEYKTFGALERQVMFLGVPLVPAAIVVIVSLLIALIGMSILKTPKTLLILVPALVVLMFMKQISAKDDQALRIVGIEILCFLQRKNAKFFGGTNTVLATKYGRNLNDYQRFLEQNTQNATSHFQLSTENLPTRNT